jgi:hypothetical protein
MIELSRRTSAERAWLTMRLVVGGGILCVAAIVSFFEAASQMSNGQASPIQLPLITTSATLNISNLERTQMVKPGYSMDRLRHYQKIARRRLALEPLDPVALWILSINASPERQFSILSLAGAVSKRDRFVQLDLMKLQASRGDIRQSFVHLDHILSVSRKARRPMLERLLPAISDARVRSSLLSYSERSWFPTFIDVAVGNAEFSTATAALVMDKNFVKGLISQANLRLLLTNLVKDGKILLAEEVSIKHSNITRSDISNFAINPEKAAAGIGPLIWTSQPALGLFVQPDKKGLVINVSSEGYTPVLSRITNKKPREYRLIFGTKLIEGRADLVWRLSCLGSAGQQIAWSQTFPITAKNIIYDVNLAIPSSCDGQQWDVGLISRSNGAAVAVEVINLL